MDLSGSIKKTFLLHKMKVSGILNMSTLIIIQLLSGVFIAFALYHDIEKNLGLIVIVSLTLCLLVCNLLRICKTVYPGFFSSCESCVKYLRDVPSQSKRRLQVGIRILVALSIFGILGYIIIETAIYRPGQLISLGGLILLLLGCVMYSTDPANIYWPTVFYGVATQIIMGLVILRWSPAQDALMWFGNQITHFIDYAKEGAKFVYGDKYTKHPFAMEVMSMLVFFSAVVSLLNQVGVLQAPVLAVSRVVSYVLGTSPTESFVAAANIFLGPNDSILMILPMVPGLSISELHVLMASGMATIGGGTLAAFVKFGIPASHLVSASLMSAPAVLVTSKILLPETSKEVPCKNKLEITKSKQNNLIEAFSVGASNAVPMVAAILSTLVGFLASLEALNATLTWLGNRAGIANLTFQVLCGKVLTPIAFLIGADWDDCGQVAALIGLKTIVNEFVAYIDLSKLIQNRMNNLTPRISKRSESVAIYALCGYSNVATMASLLAFMVVIAPGRSAELSRIAPRSLLAAILACLMTGCVAATVIMSINKRQDSQAMNIY